MALVPHKITALAESDAQGTDGKNIVAGAVVSLYDTNGTAVTLFDNESGANGSTAKQTDATGQVVVYVTAGEYDEEVNGSIRRRVMVGAKELTTLQLIDRVRPAQEGDVITTTGFTSGGDGGAAQWKASAATGLTPSQSPSDRVAAELVDSAGRLWELVIEGTIRPEMLGAVGDGTNDDHGAVQGAVSSSAGTVAYGPKTYRVNQLLPKSGQKWEGVAGITRLKVNDAASSTSSCVAMALDGSDGPLDNFSAKGIIFDSNRKESGFLVNGCTDTTFDSCEFTNNDTYGFAAQVRPGEPNYAVKDNITFINCKFNNNGVPAVNNWDGVDIKYGTNIKFINCEARDNTHTGFGVRGDVEYVNCETSGNEIVGFHAQTDDSLANNPTIVKFKNCSSNGDADGVRCSAASQNECTVTGDVRIVNATASGVAFNAPDGGGTNGVRGYLDVVVTGCVDGVKVVNTSVTSMLLKGISYGNSNHGIENDGQNVIVDMVVKDNGANGYRELTNSSNNILLPSSVFKGNTSGDIPTRVGAISDKTAFSYDNELKITAMPHLSGVPTLERASSTVARVGVSGSAADIDLDLNPKGTGMVRIGDHTASADAAVTGYIQVKDSAGTIRRLAVIT